MSDRERPDAVYPIPAHESRAKRPPVFRVRFGLFVAAVTCVFVVGFAASTGCSVAPSAFEIVDHRASGETKRYRETFDESYYDIDKSGNLMLVLRRSQPARGDAPELTQVMVVRGVWRCIPGKTIAQDTQINGTVTYALIGGRSGTTFEGAGSLFFSEDWIGEGLTGSLDLATLRPRRRIGGDEAIFDRAELSGQFHAKRDPRQVCRIVNDLERRFGSEKS
ncbi:MAG: hypothetical protein Q7R41_16315 [Phycisphaerales bacterium]|nr:hypothetical protein [Phycisphaerales bacterium]